MKFTLKNPSNKFGWQGLKGIAYNSNKDFKNASAAYFEVSESHGKVKTTLSDRIYFVIDGEGEFVIDGKKIQVRKTDVIVIPKNTPYDYRAKKGILKLFLVHVPAYDSTHEIKLK